MIYNIEGTNLCYRSISIRGWFPKSTYHYNYTPSVGDHYGLWEHRATDGLGGAPSHTYYAEDPLDPTFLNGAAGNFPSTPSIEQFPMNLPPYVLTTRSATPADDLSHNTAYLSNPSRNHDSTPLYSPDSVHNGGPGTSVEQASGSGLTVNTLAARGDLDGNHVPDVVGTRIRKPKDSRRARMRRTPYGPRKLSAVNLLPMVCFLILQSASDSICIRFHWKREPNTQILTWGEVGVRSGVARGDSVPSVAALSRRLEKRDIADLLVWITISCEII